MIPQVLSLEISKTALFVYDRKKSNYKKDSCAKQKSNFFEGYIKRLVCLSFITKFEKSQNWYSLKYKKIDGFLLA